MSTSQQILLGNAPTGGYQIERSLRFNPADSPYLNRTFSTPTGAGIWTYSAWIKRSLLDSTDRGLFTAGTTLSNLGQIYFQGATSKLIVSSYQSASKLSAVTPGVFRDVSAWYHIVVAVDMSQASGTNGCKVWINGVQQTLTITAYVQGTSNSAINSAIAHGIGSDQPYAASGYFGGYITENYFIDGQQLTASDFGEFNSDTGVWQPKAYTGSYGTNGFYLDFADNSSTTALGYDAAGSNDWTPNNFSVTAGAGNDSLVDTPTPYGTDTGVGGEVRGNYATWNPLFRGGEQSSSISATTTLTNGNLDASVPTNSFIGSTMRFTSGKWYMESVVNSVTNEILWGWINATKFSSSSLSGATANSWAAYYHGYAPADIRLNDETTQLASVAQTISNGDVLQLAWDIDSNKAWIGYQNSWYDSSGGVTGNPATGANPTFTFTGDEALNLQPVLANGTGTATYSSNFGQRPFSYTAPSGFKALVTTNLPTPTIEDGGEYFNAILYTGTGSSNARTGVGFQPDFVWIKERNAAADHGLYDVLRGVQNQLESNTTTAETAEATGLTAFGTDGFTVGALAQLNTSGDTYVAWNWKANGTGVSNTAGTITSTVSANTTAGFSIVTYTGTGANATVGHGLGVAPSMVIVKNRIDGVRAWLVYHKSVGATGSLFLDTTSATVSLSAYWNNTAPTSSVFSLGNSSAGNGSTNGMVAYCFAPVEGYSAMSSFTGNGSADGPFIFTNHRPAFVLIKRTDTTSNWTILDFQRDGYNVDNDPLYPNLSNAEGTTDLADLLSNGFKLRTTDASVNASGGTYIYMSLASNPFKFSLAR